MKIIIALILMLISTCVLRLSTQTPEILWWYDVNDSCFGNTAAGDIDGDGKLELVFGCYRNDSCVYALNAEDGSLLWKVNTGGCNDTAPIIYDVDNDGVLEVIVPASCVPKTFCIEGPTGIIEWSTYLHGSDSPPSIADVDNDGKPEILHGNFGGYVTCLNAEDGSIAWDLPVDLNSWIQTAPAILDADNDGQSDFVVANWSFEDNHRIFCYRCIDQTLLWESDLPNDHIYHGASFADIDNDGLYEIAIGTYDGTLLVLNAEDGSLKWNFSFTSPQYIGAPTSIADLNNDQLYEIVFIDGNHLGVLSNEGNLLWDFVMPVNTTSFRGCAISDINSDKILDVLFATSNGMVHALSGNKGTELWSMDLANHYDDNIFDINHAPIISDFNGDGFLDVSVVGGHTEYPEIQNNYGRAYAISTGGFGGPEWTMFRRDTARSATVTISLPSDAPDNDYTQPIEIEVYPNPFTTSTNISVFLKIEQHISISLNDLYDRNMKILFSGTLNKGRHDFTLNSSNLSNGIYIYKISGTNFLETGGIILLR